MLLTTHDMCEADELSDRVAFINDGRIHAIDTPERPQAALRQPLGEGAAARGREVVERSVPLDADDAGERLKAAVAAEGLMTIHTEEATLENIFIEMTGRGLEG